MEKPCLPVYYGLVKNNVRDRILESTETLVGKFGFGKVTVDEIAKGAGLARATVYLHFKSKKDLALACADQIHSRLLSRLRSLAAQPGSPLLRLREMLIGRVLFAFDAAQKGPSNFAGMISAIKPRYMGRREIYFDNEADIFREVLKEGIKTGEIAGHEVELTALAVVLATNALMPFSLSPRQLGARREIVQRASKIADLLLDGLRKKREPADEPSGVVETRSIERRQHVAS
jgi:AcrR family transcriptional regulator